MALTAGTRLGPYEVVAALGEGGMGEVYRAHDARLDREIALKVLPPAAADDEAARRRLVREARAVASLNHPNICTGTTSARPTAWCTWRWNWSRDARSMR